MKGTGIVGNPGLKLKNVDTFICVFLIHSQKYEN
jgi:hypothetical protein